MQIKQLREAANLKQYELAELMGVKQSSVCAWESGQANPSAENIKKLARILRCSTDAVLGYDSASA